MTGKLAISQSVINLEAVRVELLTVFDGLVKIARADVAIASLLRLWLTIAQRKIEKLLRSDQWSRKRACNS